VDWKREKRQDRKGTWKRALKGDWKGHGGETRRKEGIGRRAWNWWEGGRKGLKKGFIFFKGACRGGLEDWV
jgi:hypothetical protein